MNGNDEVKLTPRDYVMQATVVLFAVLVVFAWNDWFHNAVKYLFYLPIAGSFIYSTQVLTEEKKLKDRVLGNLIGIAITVGSLAFAIKFL